MKKWFSLLLVFIVCNQMLAQTKTSQEEEETAAVKKVFKKQLFTGGGVNFNFGNSNNDPQTGNPSANNTRLFTIGATPLLGIYIKDWVAAGLLLNYNYQSEKNEINKITLTQMGGGVFTRIFPVNQIFIQAQYEINKISYKFKNNGTTIQNVNFNGKSFLIGLGYANGKERGNVPYFYSSVMIEITKKPYSIENNFESPYRSNGRVLPIISSGMIFPLFQGKANRN